MPGVVALAYGGIGVQQCTSWEMPIWMLVFGIAQAAITALVAYLFAKLDVVDEDDDTLLITKLKALFCHDFAVPLAGLVCLGLFSWLFVGSAWLAFTRVSDTCPAPVAAMALAAVVLGWAFLVIGAACLVAGACLEWLETRCCRWALGCSAYYCCVRWCCPSLIRRSNRKRKVPGAPVIPPGTRFHSPTSSGAPPPFPPTGAAAPASAAGWQQHADPERHEPHVAGQQRAAPPTSPSGKVQLHFEVATPQAPRYPPPSARQASASQQQLLRGGGGDGSAAAGAASVAVSPPPLPPHVAGAAGFRGVHSQRGPGPR